MYKNKVVLVTGSSGFVGSKLVASLRKKGAEVITFDKQNDQDITIFECFPSLKRIDIVFHLAAITFVPYSQKNPHSTYLVNVGGTLNVLELCRNHGSKLVFTSSYLYGNPHSLPISEEHKTKPTNTYSRSKLLAEELCGIYYNDYGVPITILRPFNIYGKGQNRNFLIPLIISQLDREKISLNSKEPKRDFVHVDDVVTAYMKAGLYSDRQFDIFNIGSGESLSVGQVVEKILSLSTKMPKVEYKDVFRDNEIMNTVADITKAKELLNWEPKKSFEMGISELLRD